LNGSEDLIIFDTRPFQCYRRGVVDILVRNFNQKNLDMLNNAN